MLVNAKGKLFIGPRPVAESGFTFIELLVVMFIISLVTLLIVFKTSQPNTMRELNSFAVLIKSQMEVAREEAVLQKSVIALVISDKTYQFFCYLDSKEGPRWIPLQVSDPFWDLYKIPQSIVLEFIPSTPHQTKSGLDFSDNKALILFFPSGEISPFLLFIQAKETKVRLELSGKTNGSLRLGRRLNE